MAAKKKPSPISGELFAGAPPIWFRDKPHRNRAGKIFDFSRLKMGKLAPRFDARRLQLGHYLSPKAVDAVPATFDFTAGVAYQMWLNDQLGDCTCAASAGWLTTWLTRAGAQFTPFGNNQVEAMYEAVGGYVPGNQSTDQGAVIADVLAYLLKTGLGGYRLGAYGDVSLANIAFVKAACYFCEGLNIGIQVPTYCENTTEWLTPSRNVAGGHDILLLGVNAAGNFIGVTWDETIEVSPAFLAGQCDELHFGLSTAQMNGQGLAANGLNLAAIEADVATVGTFDTPVVPTPGPSPVPPGPTPIPPGPVPTITLTPAQLAAVTGVIQPAVTALGDDLPRRFSALVQETEQVIGEGLQALSV